MATVTDPLGGYQAATHGDSNPFAQGINMGEADLLRETDNEEESRGVMIHVVPETNRGKF